MTEARLTCYCGAPMRLRSGKHGQFWGCTRFPECDGVVGAHQGDGSPLGVPVEKETREARMRAHAAFDPLWRGKGSRFRGKRKTAYRWLSEQLGIPKGRCHIAMMDAAECARVVALCTEAA